MYMPVIFIDLLQLARVTVQGCAGFQDRVVLFVAVRQIPERPNQGAKQASQKPCLRQLKQSGTGLTRYLIVTNLRHGSRGGSNPTSLTPEELRSHNQLAFLQQEVAQEDPANIVPPSFDSEVQVDMLRQSAIGTGRPRVGGIILTGNRS